MCAKIGRQTRTHAHTGGYDDGDDGDDEIKLEKMSGSCVTYSSLNTAEEKHSQLKLTVKY